MTNTKMEKGGEQKEKEKEKICKRCHQTYTASSNVSPSCLFHPSIFVCRRHDDQKSVDLVDFHDLKMKMDALALQSYCLYYELGPNDPPYAAKFYDCCGAENPDAPGCTSAFHVSYDD